MHPLTTTLTLLLFGIFCPGGTAYTHLNDDYESYSLERTPSYAPTPGYLDREYTPSVICPSPDREDLLGQRSTSCRHQSGPAVVVKPLVRCDYDNAWDEQLPGCIHYQIEWRAKLNNRVVVKDTKQDLTLRPSSYWEDIKREASDILRRKIAPSRRVRLDDTNMVLSVKSQRDIDKRFEGTAVDWQVVEKQLLAWAYLFRLGKKIRLQISINYIDDSGPPSTDKRGKSSTTRRMLSNRDIQIDAEQTSGHDPVWRDIYRIMRCPGPPCRHEGQYCWQDPEGKRHHRLNTHHLKTLIKYVEQGGVLEDHDDVPDSFREQLYAEEEQQRKKQTKDRDHSETGSSSSPTIINNFLSTRSSQLPTPHSCANEAAPATSRNLEPIVIHGLLDIAVDEYTEWHLSRVQNQTFRDNIERARDVTLEYCLDLSQLYEDQNPDFFVQHDVKLGAARRFVRDIGLWVKQRGKVASDGINNNSG